MCRIQYSFENFLKNKILELVKSTAEQVEKILKDFPMKTQGTSSLTDLDPNIDQKDSSDLVSVIGDCLALAFPAKILQLLFPTNPDVGIRILQQKKEEVYQITQ